MVGCGYETARLAIKRHQIPVIPLRRSPGTPGAPGSTARRGASMKT